MNEIAASHPGKDTDELTGKKICGQPGQAATDNNIVYEIIEEKKPVRIMDRYNGRRFDKSGSPILDENGNVSCIAAYTRDIAREKQAELEIIEKRKYLNAIFNSTLSGVIVVDADSRTITDVNSTALEMIRLTKNEIVGQVCHNFICPAEQGKCPIADLGQVIDKSERILLTADGTKQKILKTVKPLKLAEKTYYIESFIDISNLNKAEENHEKLIGELTEALEKVKTLSGLVPICAKCKKIRDDNGYWNQLESYIEKYSEASFSHGLCPDCADALYGDKEWYIKGKKKRKKA